MARPSSYKRADLATAAHSAEAWTPCACSLQHRELMAQDNKFQQELKTLAEPASALCRRTHPAMSLTLSDNLPNDIVRRRIMF
jgi:hypothetical protein